MTAAKVDNDDMTKPEYYQVTTTRDELLNVSVADQVDVGSEKILSSLHVSEGPGRIANSPVPSVYMDDRGEIHRIRTGGKRVNLLHSQRDVMRSGYLLATESFGFVISGKVELWTLHEHKTQKKIYQANESFSVPAYVPFIQHFLQETITLEYWVGEFRCWYYHPYRVRTVVWLLYTFVWWVSSLMSHHLILLY